MRIIDVDSHFYEPLDWLEESAPKLAEQLPPPSITDFIFQFVASDLIASIPEELMPSEPMDLLPGMKPFLRRTGLRHVCYRLAITWRTIFSQTHAKCRNSMRNITGC